MKKFIVFLAFFLTQAPAFSYEEIRVYTEYSPVRILYITEGHDGDLAANKSGLKGNYKTVSEGDIPKDRTHRNAWKMASGRIVEDKALKDELTAKNAKLETAIQKLKTLGLNDDDLKALKIQKGE